MQPYNPLSPIWLTIAFLCFVIPANAQFREAYRGTDSSNHITGIHFLNTSTGYVTFSKFIGFTQDGGKTFTRRTVSISNTNYNGYPVGLTFGFAPEGVVAFTADSLLVYGHFSTEPSILFSSNGGQSWKLVSHRNLNLNASTFNNGITDIEFPGNGQIGYAVHHEQILKTVNRGQSWTVVYNTPNHFLRKISCPSQNVIFASGGNKIYKSTNGGASWINITPASGSSAHFNNIHFISDDIGYCTDYTSSQLFKSTNGGASWTKMNDEAIMPMRGDDLFVMNDSTAFIATDLYEIEKTTDNGKTWERCKRENDYQYKFYSLSAIYFLNDKTGWAGGYGEYLLSTTDGGAQTIPTANFKIDLSSINENNLVQLINYSKPGYSYKWYREGVLFSSAYNASYSRSPDGLRDEIKLIVSNGIDSDTMIQYAQFSPPMTITSFAPEVGSANRQITIRGNDFFDISSVSFGGVPAAGFLQRSGTEIVAVVSGDGASGDIRITNSTTSASKSGFVFLKDPKTDLPVNIADNVLCKEETVTLTIANTENDVYYELRDAANKSFGSAKGTGGELKFVSQPISVSGAYTVWSIRSYLTTAVSKKFSQSVEITVEHPMAAFDADKVNAEPGETIIFGNNSKEAASYAWSFPGANIFSSSAARPAVVYNAAGQKTVTLISSTANACRDTLTKNAVFVYNKPATDDVCYANNTEDEDDYYVRGRLNDMSPYVGDGYLICGNGGNPNIKSRYGTNRKINAGAVGHLARYTTDGALKWTNYVPNGQINTAVADKDGNIYLAGTCHANDFYYFSNGDSLSLIPKDFENHSLYNVESGFVMKIDASGKYLWHTLIVNPSPPNLGLPAQGGISSRIRLHGNQLIIIGSCVGKLFYYRDGNKTTMTASQNSLNPYFNLNNYILKIDTSGKYNWSAFVRNDATNQLHELSDVNFDNTGNVYVTGIHEQSAEITDFLNNTIVLGGRLAGQYGYMLKFDAQGKLLWNIHTSNNETTFKAFTFGNDGFVYLTGRSVRFVTYDPFVINNADGTTLSGDLGGFFVAKIHPDGRAVWAQGCRYSYYGSGLAVYNDGENIVCAGTAYNNGVSSSVFTFTSLRGNIHSVTLNEAEFFLIKYDTSGSVINIKGSGADVGGHLTPSRIFGDSKQNILIGGTSDHYNGGDGNFFVFGAAVENNGEDAFYAKLSPSLCSSTSVIYPRAGKDTAVCAGQPVELGLENVNGYRYSWSSYPSGFSSSSASIIAAPKVTTTYYVSLFNASGIITNDTVKITVTSPSVDAGEDKWVCAGSSVTIGSSATAKNYSWTSMPAGFTSSVANPVVNVAETTRYFLEVEDSKGCKGMDTVIVTISLPLVNAGNDTSVCKGSAVELNASGTGNTFSWTSLPAGFTSTAANPIVNATGDLQYIVELTDSVGCVVTDTVSVSAREVPAKPTIMQTADETLESSYAEGNQWYVGSELIADAGSKSYKPMTDGLYAVRVTQQGCFSEFSDPFNYKLPRVIDSPESEDVILVGPSPAQNHITINFTVENVEHLNAEIYNNRGVRVVVQKNVNSGDKMTILHLAQGVYVLKLSDDNNKVYLIRRFLKL